MNTKAEPVPRKLKAARKIITHDRRNCIERLELFWHLDCYSPREIYRAMLGMGWVWVASENKWVSANEEESNAQNSTAV